MAKGKRKGAEHAQTLALVPETEVAPKSLDGAHQVRFTKDFTATTYGLPFAFYKAGTVISNAYMIALLRKAGAPLEAV